jgi:hypothetical protein
MEYGNVEDPSMVDPSLNHYNDMWARSDFGGGGACAGEIEQ